MGTGSRGRDRCSRALALALAVAWLVVAAGGPAARAGEGAEAGPDRGPAFVITEFQLSYGGVDDPEHALYGGHPGLPPLAEILQTTVALGNLGDAFVAPAPGVPPASAPLAKIAADVQKFHASAIVSVQRQIVKELNRRGFIGIFVAAHRDDMVVEAAREGERGMQVEDLRPADRKALRLVVWTGVVTEIRTVAGGGRVAVEKRVNHPLHERIRRHSPVQPATAETTERRDLLRRDQLKRYVQFLSRHPGRRVDLSLSSAERAGGVALDYLVNENKPWYAYAQASNTGSRFTEDWRERIGFVHNQFTNHDDILTLDYITAGFDDAHAVTATYEAPIPGLERLRWRLGASWHKYTASDVGLIEDAEYTGKGWMLSGDLIANVVQWDEFFLDLLAGARYEKITVKDKFTEIIGRDELLFLHAGFRFERLTETAATWGSVLFDWFKSGFLTTNYDNLVKFGRFDPDANWTVVKFDASHAFYLEPLLNRKGWRDPNTPGSSTLAHELFFHFRGQHSMNNRLIPQAEAVVGGLYTVRGYPESIVAGDSVYIGTAEYRFHLPRLFKPKAPAKIPRYGLFGPRANFRLAPQNVYGRPDWDLILRAFYDYAHTDNVRLKSYEVNEKLQSIGVGAELRLRTNISLRCDYGLALDDVFREDRTVESGDTRLHGVITISF